MPEYYPRLVVPLSVGHIGALASGNTEVRAELHFEPPRLVLISENHPIPNYRTDARLVFHPTPPDAPLPDPPPPAPRLSDS